MFTKLPLKQVSRVSQPLTRVSRGNLFRSQWRHQRNYSRTHQDPRNFSRIGVKGTAAASAIAIVLGAGAYSAQQVQLDTPSSHQRDEANVIKNTVAVDNSIDPFPTQLPREEHPNLHGDYVLLGHGVRSVTFLGFKVYGVGVYISQADLPRVKKLLSPEWCATFGTENHSLKELLEDPAASPDIIGRLLDNGIRFTVRICPVRNTDFGHLRDGLVKSILAHPNSKTFKVPVSEGLEQLREVFQGFRGSVPKNHLLWLEIESGESGKLHVSYENPSHRQPAKREVKVLGTVNNSMVGNTLMLQYLSGAKPLSQPLRQSCVDGLVAL